MCVCVCAGETNKLGCAQTMWYLLSCRWGLVWNQAQNMLKAHVCSFALKADSIGFILVLTISQWNTSICPKGHFRSLYLFFQGCLFVWGRFQTAKQVCGVASRYSPTVTMWGPHQSCGLGSPRAGSRRIPGRLCVGDVRLCLLVGFLA